MTSRIKRRGLQGLLPISGLLLALASCNVSTEDGHTYMNVAKDSTWSAFDSLEITWVDSSSGKSGVLYQGKPEKLGAMNKLPADGYLGQRITLEYQGFHGDSLISKVRQTFDPITPKEVKLDTVISPRPGKKNPPLGIGPLPTVTALDTFTISIHDSVTFLAHASVDSGALASFAFDYDGDGVREDSMTLSGSSAAINGGYRFHLPATYTTHLRVRSARGAMTEVTGRVHVLLDPPTADAGPEQTVFTGDTVRLNGIGKDSLGKIVRMEWKFGTGAYALTAGPGVFQAPSAPGDITATFRVTDDDSQSVSRDVIIHVKARPQPSLTALSVSAGTLSPRFDPSDTAYVDTLPFTTGVFSVIPTGNGTLTVNGTAVTSGQSSANLNLTVGANTFVIVVHLPAVPDKTYRLQVQRMPASGNANLTAMTISSGTLDPAFSPLKTAYADTVANAVTSLTITGTLADTLSALTVNGSPTASGTAAPVKLGVGTNPVALVAVAQSGVSKIYTVTITRLPNAETTLAALAVSSGALSPVFNSATSAYTVAVANATTSLVITPKASAATSRIKIGADSLAAGASSKPIALSVGTNAITVTVIAENLAAQNYHLEVTRARNGNSDLDSLETSLGPVSPDFTLLNKTYFLYAGYHVQAITVKAKAHQATTRLTVNGSPVASGVASDSIPLTQVVTTVRITSTAEDSTSQTNVITVTHDTVSRELVSDFETRSSKTPFGSNWNYYDDRTNGGGSLITSGDTSGAVTLINNDSWASGNAGSMGALKLGFRLGPIPPTCGTGCTYGNYVAAHGPIHTTGSPSADLTGATSISFFAKADTAINVLFQVQTSDVLDFAFYNVVVPVTTSWAIYTVKLAEPSGGGLLTQPVWGVQKPFNIKKVSGIDFEIRQDENPVLKKGELQVDDIYINNWRK